jgi:hypothetical protein
MYVASSTRALATCSYTQCPASAAVCASTSSVHWQHDLYIAYVVNHRVAAQTADLTCFHAAPYYCCFNQQQAPVMDTEVLREAMQSAEDFLQCLPSVKHLAAYAAWVKATEAHNDLVQQRQQQSSDISDTHSVVDVTAAASVAVSDNSAASAAPQTAQSSTRSLGITAETWSRCTAAYSAYGCTAQAGPGSIMQAASGCKMRDCKCRRGELLHIREDGCECDCVHCHGCNLEYCICGLKRGSVCTDVLCTCTSLQCYRALRVPTAPKYSSREPSAHGKPHR